MKRDPLGKSFEAGELEIRIDLSPGKLKLIWLGRSVGRDPSLLLKPLFDGLAPYLDKDREVELDFRKFEYMNSSTLKPILTFVQRASGDARAVQVRYDSQKNWQRLSFKLLQAVASSLTNVSVESRQGHGPGTFRQGLLPFQQDHDGVGDFLFIDGDDLIDKAFYQGQRAISGTPDRDAVRDGGLGGKGDRASMLHGAQHGGKTLRLHPYHANRGIALL